MAYLDEFVDSAKLNGAKIDCKIIILDFNSLLIEGYKKIDNFCDNEIVLSVKNKRKVKIIGSRLYILSFNKQEVVVKGDIFGVEYVWNKIPPRS